MISPPIWSGVVFGWWEDTADNTAHKYGQWLFWVGEILQLIVWWKDTTDKPKIWSVAVSGWCDDTILI